MFQAIYPVKSPVAFIDTIIRYLNVAEGSRNPVVENTDRDGAFWRTSLRAELNGHEVGIELLGFTPKDISCSNPWDGPMSSGKWVLVRAAKGPDGGRPVFDEARICEFAKQTGAFVKNGFTDFKAFVPVIALEGYDQDKAELLNILGLNQSALADRFLNDPHLTANVTAFFAGFLKRRARLDQGKQP